MAKMKRLKIGSVIKSKDPAKADYIKLDDKLPGGTITFKAGDYIQVESKAYQLSSLEKAIADGKLSEENAEKARDRINNIKDFIRAELVVLRAE